MTTATPPTTTLPAADEDARRLLLTEARTANTFTGEPVSDERLRTIYRGR